MTNQSIKFASVSISRVTTAIADTPYYEQFTHLHETDGSILPMHKIERGKSAEWQAAYHVPALTPSMEEEGLLSIQYYAQLSIGFERGSAKRAVVRMKVPITLGTVAIGSSDGSVSALHQRPAKPPVQIDEKSPALPPPSAPPAYDTLFATATVEGDDVPPPLYPAL